MYFQGNQRYFLFRHNTDTLLNMVSIHCLIHHGNSIVGIADHTLPFGIQRQFFTAKNICSSAFSLRTEITGRAEIRPSDVVSLTELSKRLCHCRGKRLECIRELRTIRHTDGMLRIYKQASRATDHQKPGIGSGKNVTQMLQRRTVLRKRILCPCAESIDDNIETAQVIRRQIKQILLQNLFRLRPILAPNNIREPRSDRLPQLLLILYANRYQS